MTNIWKKLLKIKNYTERDKETTEIQKTTNLGFY